MRVGSLLSLCGSRDPAPIGAFIAEISLFIQGLSLNMMFIILARLDTSEFVDAICLCPSQMVFNRHIEASMPDFYVGTVSSS